MEGNTLKPGEAMDLQARRINRDLIVGWLIIAIVLLVTYTMEVVKGERTLAYFAAFAPVVILPLLLVFLVYRRRPDWYKLCYLIVPGYFVMYIFVMLTGSTSMVFSYILPMLSLLVLYHHPNLILFTGVASILVNLFSVWQKYQAGLMTVSNSKEAEIQLALIVLCFSGSYLATRLYNSITKQNNDYLKMLQLKNKQIQDMSLQTITTIAHMLDARDSYTEGHSQRVANYAVALAQELGFSMEDIENVRKVALLHDIGKVGIPDSLLNKPGRLTDEEFSTMKQHTTVGHEIIRNVSSIPGLQVGVRHHHERYDGHGYPDGLKGEDIPYVARIISVADSYDAMTSNRVYRKRLEEGVVLEELERCAGSQFDPVIARKMVDLLKKGVIKNLSPDMAQSPA